MRKVLTIAGLKAALLADGWEALGGRGFESFQKGFVEGPRLIKVERDKVTLLWKPLKGIVAGQWVTVSTTFLDKLRKSPTSGKYALGDIRF